MKWLNSVKTYLPLMATAIFMLFFGACASEPVFLTEEPIVTVSPSPSPSATPTPVVISYSGNLLSDHGRLAMGLDEPLFGEITCNYPLEAVILTDQCDYNDDPLYPCEASVTFSRDQQLLRYDLDSAETLEGISLDEAFDFSVLTPGVHQLKLEAVCSGCEKLHSLETVEFYVLSDDWQQINPSDFRGSYDEALAFFHDKDRFCYRYQTVYGRYTVADPDWEEAYIVSLDGFGGRPWLVHRDAVPFYEQAFSYLRSELVRVHGTNGDTGVLPLSDLVYTYNGSYVSRFTSSLKTISHHAFGAATDLNARMEPNLNRKENRKLIDDEVRDCLVYNGIFTENGLMYYDFTYSGDYQKTVHDMPESIVNYLLYELAFYRAGFDWGHYYISTSDAMHFTLTDQVKIKHDDPEKGLKKVFTYIPQAALPADPAEP